MKLTSEHKGFPCGLHVIWMRKAIQLDPDAIGRRLSSNPYASPTFRLRNPSGHATSILWNTVDTGNLLSCKWELATALNQVECAQAGITLPVHGKFTCIVPHR